MNSQWEKKSEKKRNADSGLENASDSGNSFDEDGIATSSDVEDSLSSDSDSDSPKNEKESRQHPLLTNSRSEMLASLTDLNRISNFSVKVDVPGSRHQALTMTQEESGLKESVFDGDPEDIAMFSNALTRGRCEALDFTVDSKSPKPDWLDGEKFKRGQKFARDHLFCINFAEMVSLFILFAQKSSLGPLIFTGKSDSPFTAFNRYLKTLSKLISWYTDDLWSENENLGKNNLILVRGMHKSVFHSLSNLSEVEFAVKTSLGDPRTTALWCPLRDLLLEDFRESVLPPPTAYKDFQGRKEREVWISQTDMAVTQFGFVGLAVTYPESFGIHLASDEDLEAFLHMWRGLGFLLGIKDEYNYCGGDLKSVRERTVVFLERIAKPAFRNVTCDWEHMCRCLTAGVSFYLPPVNFESSLLYLCHVLGIRTPRLRKEMRFSHYLIYLLHRLVFYLMRYPPVLSWLNSRLYRIIERVETASPEVLNRWKSRKFSYMTQPGKCPIRGQFSNPNS